MMIDFEKQAARMGADIRFGLATKVDLSGQPFKVWIDEEKLLLADEKQIARSLARQLAVYATGAPIRFADREEIERVLQRASSSHYGVRSLVHELVQSELFLMK